jgi:chemotaxis protein histidine kinase CheA
MPGAPMRDDSAIDWDDVEFHVDLGPLAPAGQTVDLRARAARRPGKARDDFDPVAAAEAAVARLSSSFNLWVEEKVQHLADLFGEAKAAQFAPDHLNRVYQIAHDLKGEAATFGYPLAGRVAGSLCLLLDYVMVGEPMPEWLAVQHIQALRAMVHERVRDEGSATAQELADSLRIATERQFANSATHIV